MKQIKRFSILLVLFLLPVLAEAQSLIGTWHSTGMLMLSESAREQKLIITKDSIHILSTREQYSYVPSDDTNFYEEYRKNNNGENTELYSIKIASIIPDKLTDRGYMTVITPTFTSSK